MKHLIYIILISISFYANGQTLTINLDTSTSMTSFLFPSPGTRIDTTICTTSIGFLDNQVRVGNWKFFNCNLDEKVDFSEVYASANYVNGQLEGKYVSFYSDSTIKSWFTFQKGELNGEFECFNKQGVKIYSGYIDKGFDKIEGEEYYSTGGAFKHQRSFLVASLRREWMLEIK